MPHTKTPGTGKKIKFVLLWIVSCVSLCSLMPPAATSLVASVKFGEFGERCLHISDIICHQVCWDSRILKGRIIRFMWVHKLSTTEATTRRYLNETTLEILIFSTKHSTITLSIFKVLKSLYGHKKPQSNGHQYGIGTLAVDGWLLHLVQQGWAWAGCGPAQSPPRCTKYNRPRINGLSFI